MNVKPLRDRVLVKRTEENEEQVRGGIIIPDSAKEKSQEAEVIAVGPGKTDDQGNVLSCDVKKGDRVIISAYGGTSIKVDGTELIIIECDNILAIVE